MTVQAIKTKSRKISSTYTPARLTPLDAVEPAPIPPHDFATAERKAFIERVSPFLRAEERAAYFRHVCGAVIFGRKLPHERRAMI